MFFSIDLLDTNSEIQKAVFQEIINTLNKKASLAIPRIQKQLSSLIKIRLKDTLIYKEAVSGVLKAHFGFEKGREREIMNGIIDIISREIQIDLQPFKIVNNSEISGGYTIYMIDSEFRNALSSNYAVTINKDQELPWLEWLLKEGDRIIITGYKILLKNTKHGRSKKAIMIKGGISNPFWRVPSQFSGVENLNWITRAFKGENVSDDFVLNDIKNEMENIIYSNLEKVL